MLVQEVQVNYETIIPAGTPVIVRSYTSGVVVGKIQCGSGGVVGLTHWRWLRRWENVGGEGSVYDLVHSDKTPTHRGPLIESLTLLQQADIMTISKDAYERISG